MQQPSGMTITLASYMALFNAQMLDTSAGRVPATDSITSCCPVVLPSLPPKLHDVLPRSDVRHPYRLKVHSCSR